MKLGDPGDLTKVYMVFGNLNWRLIKVIDTDHLIGHHKLWSTRKKKKQVYKQTVEDRRETSTPVEAKHPLNEWLHAY